MLLISSFKHNNKRELLEFNKTNVDVYALNTLSRKVADS